MKKIFLFLLPLVLLPLLFEVKAVTPPENVLRLHVVAASDSERDQQIKLRVRDAIVETTADLLKGCETKEDAQAVLAASLDLLTKTANDALAAQNVSHRAEITLTKESYPAKTYAGITLPEGEYTSLRVNIDQAKGQNWWCVLFPSLCLSTSVAGIEEAFIDAGFSPDQVRDLTDSDENGIVIRFRFLEWIKELFS